MTDRSGPSLALAFTLDGRPVRVETATSTSLADLLREDLGHKGAKLSCSRAVCGACTVLVDGRPTASCATFAFEVEGTEVRTVEGLAKGGELSPVQAAFADLSAFQCGYCTSGMIMLATALLEAEPDPSRETIVEWISSNICRCTGYTLIVEAVQEAARRRNGTGEAIR